VDDADVVTLQREADAFFGETVSLVVGRRSGIPPGDVWGLGPPAVGRLVVVDDVDDLHLDSE
jgi:hypothetical protein